MHREVADEHEEKGVRGLHAFGQHPHEGGGQHEARTGGDEVAKGRPPVPVGLRDERCAGDVRGSGDGHENPLC